MARVKNGKGTTTTTTAATVMKRQTLIPKTRKATNTATATIRRRPMSRREVMKRMGTQEGSHLVPAQEGCIRDNGTLMDQVLTLYRIGGESKNGEALRSCYPIICKGRTCTCDEHNPDFMTLVVKKVPLYN